jgi:hypothetical protein
MALLEITEDLLTRIAKLPKDSRTKSYKLLGEREFERCAEDPVYWMDSTQHVKTKAFPEGMPYVYTKDPHIIFRCNECQAEVMNEKRATHLELKHGEIKPTLQVMKTRFTELPAYRPFSARLLHEYMKPLVEEWTKAQFMAVEKSRDMMATWLFVTLFTWDSMFHIGRQNIFQSQDAPKTLELVQRSKIIYDQTPKFLRDAIGPIIYRVGTTRSGEFFVVKQNSEILGFPQGPDQIRQFHPSGVFVDEGAFQILAGDSFAAIKPAIQQGGRYTTISSANRSHFELICRDRTDE